MRNNKYEKILSVAGALITQKGYNGTSFQEIADGVGIHKTTLFHYFRNKEELLLRILEKSVDEVNLDISKIANSNKLEPQEKLRKLFDHQLTTMLYKHSDNVNAYLYELRNLSEKNRRKYLKKRKRYENCFKKIIAEMKTKGYFNGLDTKIVTFGLLGMLNWVAKWYKKDGAKSINEVSNIFYRVVTGE
jgi:TetR/AcrR family transcriptional regulator, cholesterol catabolism regulator